MEGLNQIGKPMEIRGTATEIECMLKQLVCGGLEIREVMDSINPKSEVNFLRVKRGNSGGRLFLHTEDSTLYHCIADQVL